MAKNIDVKILLGMKIKEIREKRNLTQEKLAEMIDVNTNSISNFERGVYFPSDENLTKLANALDVPYEVLFVNDIIEPQSVKEDFYSRIEKIMENPEKFTILYNYLKILT